MAARGAQPTGLEEAIAVGQGVERPFRCHMHDDANASASVNVEKGLWVCYACGAAGRVDRKGATLTAAMKQARSALLGLTVAPEVPERWLAWTDAAGPHPYWERRFGPDACARHRLGTCPATAAPCYPFRDADGVLRGIVRRLGLSHLKYHYPAGASVATTLFNIGALRSMRRGSVVVVTEGAADAIAVEEALAVSPLRWRAVVVAAYGSGLHRPQVELINAQAPAAVLLGFDMDAAGDRAAGRDYGLNARTARVSWPENDPGECSAEQIVGALQEGKESLWVHRTMTA